MSQPHTLTPHERLIDQISYLIGYFGGAPEFRPLVDLMYIAVVGGDVRQAIRGGQDVSGNPTLQDLHDAIERGEQQ